MASIIEGIYRDRLVDASGRLLSDSGWRHNMIVLHCRVLLGAFLHNEGSALGVQSMQVGRGDPSWDTAPPPLPDASTTTQLTDGSPFVVQGANLVLEYLDATESIVASPTNRVQVTATLGPNEPTPSGSPPFPLREFGLFGSLQGVPFMIDYVRHPLIEKDGAVTLERKVRLVL